MQRFLMPSLINWKSNQNRKPLLLKGARQVGKTYLLKTFGKEFFPKCHYVNFEKEALSKIFETDLSPKKIITELNFHFNTSINIQEDLLIFDEIQACPKALTSLKYFCEEMPELALTAAGSLLGVKLNSESFPVGKVDWLSLYPMTFLEFLLGIGEDALYHYAQNLKHPNTHGDTSDTAHEKLWERLKHYFIVGGLPEVVSLFAEHQAENLFLAFQTARERQFGLLRDYYADIAKHSGKINAMHIDRVWQAIPAQLAKVQESSSQRFRFKDVVPGIDRFSRLANVIDWLINAGLILKSSIVSSGAIPLSAYAEEGFFKLFIFDTGLLGAMMGLAPKTLLDQTYGTYKGYFAENFVAQSLVASEVLGITDDPKLFTWQEGTAEVEFLCEIAGEIIPIEVKSGSHTHAKSLSQFSQKYAPPYRVIYSAKNFYLDQNSKTQWIPLYLAGAVMKQ